MAAFVGPNELVASEGDNVSFFCYGAYGSGGYSYLWLNDQNELVGNQTSLDIPFLTSNMTGEYTCLAHDDTGQEANGTVHLTVLSKGTTRQIFNGIQRVFFKLSTSNIALCTWIAKCLHTFDYSTESAQPWTSNTEYAYNTSMLVARDL